MDFRPDLSWEFLSQDEIKEKTLRAFVNHISHAKEVSSYYREVLADINPLDIKSLDDISKLPFTDKTTLANNIEKFWAVNPQDVVETVITSGSSGYPLVFFMTQNDLDRLAFNEAMSFYGLGVTSSDRAQIMVSLDRMFIAGMAYYRGLTLLGANTSRTGVLPAEMQLNYLKLLKPTVVVCVPSFLRKLAKEFNKMGFDTRKSSIQKIVCIGESIRNENLELNAVGKDLEDLFNAHVFSTYGITELSLAYSECNEQKGNHSKPELVYTEIVDDDGNPVPDGTPGELVATPFGVEGMPLVRYRTGDITYRISEPCSCGRNSCRIGPILARKSQMIKVRGTTLYPLTITNALDELDYIEDYIVLLDGDASLADDVTIHVVTQPSMYENIVNHLRAKTRVILTVLISNSATVNAYRKNSRKKIKIVDSRKHSH